MRRGEMDDPHGRLSHVLAEQGYPASRWELIATAQAYGADWRSLAELQAIPAVMYPTFVAVARAVSEVPG